MFSCLFKKYITIETGQSAESAREKLDTLLTHHIGESDYINLKGKFISRYEFTATTKRMPEVGNISQKLGNRNWWLPPNARCKIIDGVNEAIIEVKFTGDDMVLFALFFVPLIGFALVSNIWGSGFLPFWSIFMVLIITGVGLTRVNTGREEIVDGIVRQLS